MLFNDVFKFGPAESARSAFINEYNLMLESGYQPLKHQADSKLYNLIWSPGKNFIGK
jgi:hypothetical protein